MVPANKVDKIIIRRIPELDIYPRLNSNQRNIELAREARHLYTLLLAIKTYDWRILWCMVGVGLSLGCQEHFVQRKYMCVHGMPLFRGCLIRSYPHSEMLPGVYTLTEIKPLRNLTLEYSLPLPQVPNAYRSHKSCEGDIQSWLLRMNSPTVSGIHITGNDGGFRCIVSMKVGNKAAVRLTRQHR